MGPMYISRDPGLGPTLDPTFQAVFSIKMDPLKIGIMKEKKKEVIRLKQCLFVCFIVKQSAVKFGRGSFVSCVES